MRARSLGWLMIAALATACACKQKPADPGTGNGTGTGTGADGDCDSLGQHARDLYQASAERTKLTPEEVEDNAGMVVNECRTNPGLRACAGRATSVAQLEACLAPLDEDGSEGLQFQNK